MERGGRLAGAHSFLSMLRNPLCTLFPQSSMHTLSAILVVPACQTAYHPITIMIMLIIAALHTVSAILIAHGRRTRVSDTILPQVKMWGPDGSLSRTLAGHSLPVCCLLSSNGQVDPLS
eukprot:3076914-Rhodomonas_salina.4